jgi:hypothetical protein
MSVGVGYTCPSIDKAIGEIDFVVKNLEKILDAVNDDGIYGVIDDAIYALNNVAFGRRSILEELRSSNAELRYLAETYSADLKDMENSYNSLLSDYEDLLIHSS